MIDPVAAGIGAVFHRDPSGLPVVFLAGALTSVGPCVAPRYVALAALGSAPRRLPAILTFVAGILAAYATVGYGAGVLGMLWLHAEAVDELLAIALSAAGLVMLIREPHPAGCAHPTRLSAAFALGAGSAAVISPCCTPVVAAVAALAAAGREPLGGALALAAFALGHCALPALLGCGGSVVAAKAAGWTNARAPRTVAGALLLGLGGYYAVLA